MQPEADVLVLFGATGDLSKRKLFPSLYNLERDGRLHVPVIGVARSDWSDEGFRQHAHDAILATRPDAMAAVIDSLCARLDLVAGDYADIATFQTLAETLDRHHSTNAVFYFAIPPSAFPLVIESLETVGLTKRGRVVVEKPFGRDLASARELNAILHKSFPEERIFRIDHYLGKESVEDLMVFRFSNVLLEPVWKRNYVRSVQVTMAETIGVEGRGSFYDSVGALRDVVQNHLLQVVALLAMEPPVGPEADFLQDEKAKVFAATESICCSDVVRGQYVGYLDEEGVAPGSTTRDVRGRAAARSTRGGGPACRSTSGPARRSLTPPPRPSSSSTTHRACSSTRPEAPRRTGTWCASGSGKDDGVTFTLQAKTPGEHMDSEDVNLTVDFAAALGERQDAYERLLGDALAGNPRRFARQDVVERTWRIVQPMLDDPGPVFPYERGSWGPPEADALVPGGWYPPS